MQDQFFTHGEYTLAYQVYGHGKKTLLYFHGYRKNAGEFAAYELPIENEFTVYSFNFFHHGLSIYPDERIHQNTLTGKELAEIVNAFLYRHGVDRFSLMGYSMGGKICLGLLQFFEQRVDQLILVAPDGVKRNFWYRFTSNNRLGNALYRKIIKHPQFFFFTIKVLRKTGLLSRRLYDFVYQHLETEEKRRHVYKVWMTLRHIDPLPADLARIIRKNGINTCLNFGRHDKVVSVKTGKKFHALIGAYSQLNVLEKGHKMANALTGKQVAVFLQLDQTKDCVGSKSRF